MLCLDMAHRIERVNDPTQHSPHPKHLLVVSLVKNAAQTKIIAEQNLLNIIGNHKRNIDTSSRKMNNENHKTVVGARWESRKLIRNQKRQLTHFPNHWNAWHAQNIIECSLGSEEQTSSETSWGTIKIFFNMRSHCKLVNHDKHHARSHWKSLTSLGDSSKPMKFAIIEFIKNHWTNNDASSVVIRKHWHS